MSEITIQLNGHSQILNDTSLQSFLKAQNIDVSCIAVAVNSEIVPSAKIAATKLKTGDCVEIVHAVCGG